jgi:hypothetical protein
MSGASVTQSRLARTGKHKKRKSYMADFETRTREDNCSVWLWGVTPLDNPTILDWGITIESFIEFVQRESSIQYFHNLKFDGHFIVDHLLRQNYEHRADSGRGMEPGQFRTLISGMNKWYSVTVTWRNGNVTEFRDSLKKLNMPIAAIAETYKLGMTKGDIDYHAERPEGYEPTEDELDYLQRDIGIGAKAMKQLLDQGATRLTIGSDSMAEYKKLVGDKYFQRMFPTLSDSMDAEIRRAYRGGFTYCDPRFQGVKTRSGIVLDVNSLYPSVMYNNILPYGEPEWMEGEVTPHERRPLTVFSVTFTAKIKPNHIPCIQIKGSSIFGGTEYLTEIADPTTLMVTNVDWELYQEQYDIQVIAWGGGWRFRGAQGLFKEYIDKWSKIKAESTGGLRAIAKDRLNTLYGKFASNPRVTGKVPVLEDDRVKFVTGPEERKPPVYTAMGVFITSYARALTVRAAQALYPVFAYADTDSLHFFVDDISGLIGRKPEEVTAADLGVDIDIHPTRMGAWKFEYCFTEAWFVRAKAYLEKLAGVDNPCPPECAEDHKHARQYKVAWAGLPQKEQEKLTFDDLWDGHVIHGKLQPRSVPGGVILEDVPYKLNTAK